MIICNSFPHTQTDQIPDQPMLSQNEDKDAFLKKKKTHKKNHKLSFMASATIRIKTTCW